MADIYDSYYEHLAKKTEEPQKPQKKKFKDKTLNEIVTLLEENHGKWIQTSDILNNIYFNESRPKLLMILKEMYKAKIIDNKIEKQKHYWKIKKE